MKVQDVINRIIDAQNADPFDAEATTDVLTDAMELLKEQEAIIEQYRRADGFLAAHGWKWEER